MSTACAWLSRAGAHTRPAHSPATPASSETSTVVPRFDEAAMTSFLHLGPAVKAWRPGSDQERTGRTAIALTAVLAFALVLRLIDLGGESLWNDEAFTWWWIQQPPGDLWGPNAAQETSPPLYYMFAWAGCRLFGDGEAALRLPSVLFGTLGVGAVFILGRAVGGTRAGLLAALLTATAAPHIYYSQEARTYALLSLLGTLAVLGLLAFFRHVAPAGGARGLGVWGLALYGSATIGALYTHNTALLLPLIANIAALGWWLAGPAQSSHCSSVARSQPARPPCLVMVDSPDRGPGSRCSKP